MRQLLFVGIVCATVGMAAVGEQTQQTPPPSSADPYLNNAAAGATSFPLAAPAGKDSHARTDAPAGAVNQGPFAPGTWKYGPAFTPPPMATVATGTPRGI